MLRQVSTSHWFVPLRSPGVATFSSQLIIKPGQSGEVEESYSVTFSFQDFIHLFPNLKTMSVYWTVYPEGAPHFNMLPSCEQHIQALSKDGLAHIPPTLNEIRIRAVYHQWYYDNRPADALNHNQVRCLVRQLQFPSVQRIAFSFVAASSLLAAMDRHSFLSSIIEACNECRISDLTEAILEINLAKDGSTREVDICVSTLEGKASRAQKLTCTDLRTCLQSYVALAGPKTTSNS